MSESGVLSQPDTKRDTMSRSKPSAEPEVHTLVGRYQLVAQIGAGGMGRVWVALDTAAPGLRLVALKTSLSGSDGGMNPDFWAVLADEAALASRITHPNVCATHELGQEGDVHFLVMDWSDGASLRDLLNAVEGNRLSPELAAYVCAGVASGLHAAHELTDDDGHLLGVVHRDVSPQNVLVSTRGQVRLADFGVAKSRVQLHRATETGEVKGKLSYMAPEQVTSRDIDRRADIFALGCVLYEATLGVRPFHGADALATMYKILESELMPPRERDPAFPEELERVLLKALAKDPNQRYQTAEEFRDALVEYLSTTGRFFTDKHVAEVLNAALGSQLTERNRAVYASAERLRRGEQAEPLRSPPPPRAHETLTPEGGVERTVTALHQRSNKLLSVAAVAGIVVAAGLAFAFFRSPPARPEAAVQSSPVVAVPALDPSVVAPSTTPVPSVTAAPTVSTAPPPTPTVLMPSTRTVPRGPVAAAPPASAAPAAAVTGRPSGRGPRPIDRSNPFADAP
jgi:eukaryotic-like serine/threonine-protein kinase